MHQDASHMHQEVLRSFVENYFEDVGSDLDPWSPSDFQESPPFLAHVEEKRKAWAKALNGLWATLGRKSKAHSQQRCSSLPLRNPTIVPGRQGARASYSLKQGVESFMVDEFPSRTCSCCFWTRDFCFLDLLPLG